MINLKAENIELSGDMATVTLSAPLMTGMVDRGKAALQEREPETPKQDQSQDGVVKKESRLISAVVIEDCWCPFDLTKPGVLKAALPLFKGLGLFKDHYRSVDNNIGGVRDCYYDDKSTPPGINGWACIDRELDPLSALRVERGWVSRFSITLTFKYEKSHKMDDDTFWRALGEVVDGQLVRLIVTKITSITEVSLVYFGADPNAKVLSMSKDENALNNNALEVSREIQEKEVNQVDEEIKALLEAALKKEIKTEVQYIQAVKTILADREILRGENLSLEKQVESLQKAKEFQETVTETLRENVLKDAIKVGLGKVKTSHEMLITGADYNALLELKKEYQADLKKLFPLKCVDCGSTNVESRSSVELRPPEPKATENHTQEISMSDLHQ